MKTMIWNGSPRKSGDTSSLVEEIVQHLNGEYKIVNAYQCKIQPCMDCRYCRQNQGCCIQDEMQEIYSYIQECDNILIASPIYFSELTGALLNMASRLQMYYSAKAFRKEKPIEKVKKGAVILVGGGDGSVQKPYETACTLLRLMNAHDIYPLVFSHDTDIRPAVENQSTMAGVGGIANYFNAFSTI